MCGEPTRDLSWTHGVVAAKGQRTLVSETAEKVEGTDLTVAKRRVLGRLSSCSGEGGRQMGGGEQTREHRKVEAVGVGWESWPSPHLIASDRAPEWDGLGSSPLAGRVGTTSQKQDPGVSWLEHSVRSDYWEPDSLGPLTTVMSCTDLGAGVLGPSLASPSSLWVFVLSSLKRGWASGPRSTDSQVRLTITKLVSPIKCRIQPPASYPPSPVEHT